MGKPGAAVRAAGWITVGIVAAGGVAAAATSDGSSSSASNTSATTVAATPSAAPGTAAGKHGRAGRLAKLRGRMLHGQFTVLGKDSKPVQVAEQRGTVDAVSPTSITLTSKDGFKQTYVVTADTKVRVDGQKSTIDQVKAGQNAGVLATVDGSTQTAKAVIERAAK